jgi:aryl carrier-like protein
VLLGHPDVIQAAVLATGAGEYRQLVGCVAVTDPALTEPVLRAYLADRLPQHLVPARLPILPALPLNPNGKVDRRALEHRLAGDLTAPAAAPVVAPPHSAAERRLHGIWCAVLDRPDVGVHDNFFGIGGDSIRGLQVVTRARNAGLPLTVRDLFDRQTIAALAALADTRRPEPAPVAAQRATGLSDSQLRGALARLRKGD